jgi:hypothetical protein
MRPVEGQLSSELETLDQLLSGDMTLSVIRQVFAEDDVFLRGVRSLLAIGDVVLLDKGEPVPEWRLRQLFSEGAILDNLERFTLRLTDQGASRIA